MRPNSKKGPIDQSPDSEKPDNAIGLPGQAEATTIAGDGDPDGSVATQQSGAGVDSTGGSSMQEQDQTPGEELNAEQQKAFESIMAQIEKGGGTDTDSDVDAESSGGNPSGPDEDFSGDLEKVVKEAETLDGLKSESEMSGEELNAEQQKAFESIMAQIEKGGGTDTDGDVDAESSGGNPSDSDEDFSAELEKVVREGNAGSGVQEKDAEWTEELDEDQQKAFESIMAQIQGDAKEKAVPDAEAADSSELSPDQAEGLTERPSAAPSEDGAEDSSQEVPDDIEKILQEITMDAAPSPDADATPAEALSEKPHGGPADASHAAEQSGGAKNGAIENQPDDAAGNASSTPKMPQEVHPASGPEPLPLPAKGADPENRRPSSTASPLRETAHPSEHRRYRVIMAAALFLVLSLAAYAYWRDKPSESFQSASMPRDGLAQGRVVDTQPPTIERSESQQPADQEQSDHFRLTATVEQLNQLRGQLIGKASEIEELRTYYQSGIDAEIQEIVAALSRTGKASHAFNLGMADTRISLGLEAIQRRDTYIRKLVSPADTLYRGSEELLFWSRKAGLLSMMAAKTSDIDVDGYIAKAAMAMERHRRALTELNIDAVPAAPRDLESIWREILARLPKQPVGTRAGSDDGADSQAISKRICDGDFADKDRLTRLSPEVARCLAQWKGKDLFLNAVTDLQPDAARHLADWEGDWLGLNGLKELSPETAIHLARWKGKGLSLNGLSRLSPRVVAILSEWQGQQIELINVKHMAHWENPNTRLFLSEDLNRKLNAARK